MHENTLRKSNGKFGILDRGGGALSLTTEIAPPVSNSHHTIYHVLGFAFEYCINFFVAVLTLYVILCCRYVLVAYIVSMYCISI